MGKRGDWKEVRWAYHVLDITTTKRGKQCTRLKTVMSRSSISTTLYLWQFDDLYDFPSGPRPLNPAASR
jgi:hypothetical protein